MLDWAFAWGLARDSLTRMEATTRGSTPKTFPASSTWSANRSAFSRPSFLFMREKRFAMALRWADSRGFSAGAGATGSGSGSGTTATGGGFEGS